MKELRGLSLKHGENEISLQGLQSAVVAKPSYQQQMMLTDCYPTCNAALSGNQYRALTLVRKHDFPSKQESMSRMLEGSSHLLFI